MLPSMLAMVAMQPHASVAVTITEPTPPLHATLGRCSCVRAPTDTQSALQTRTQHGAYAKCTYKV
jgi:hypothetical protein